MNSKANDIVRADCIEVLKNQADRLGALRGETLVVTGGTGFLGTWIAELVACLNDCYSFGTQLVLVARSTDQFRTARPHLAHRKDVVLIKSDVRHMFEVPKETNWLIHAASSPDNRFHASNPVETMMGIADGTASVLRAVDRCSNFKMFANISSGMIYGAQPWEMERIPESYTGAPQCGAITSAYAEAKRYAETLCCAAKSQARTPAISVRPFAFIGPYQSLETPWAINNFLWDALSGNPIRVLGDGETVRSYMYPSDAAFWLLALLTQGTPGQTYNLGSPTGITLAKLAEIVSTHFTPRPEIRLRAGLTAALQKNRFIPDTSFVEKKFGLNHTVSLEKALNRTIEWHRARG